MILSTITLRTDWLTAIDGMLNVNVSKKDVDYRITKGDIKNKTKELTTILQEYRILSSDDEKIVYRKEYRKWF